MDNNAAQLIQSLMSDPEMSGKLRGLLQSLGGGGDEGASSEEHVAEMNTAPQSVPAPMPGEVDFAAISKIQNVYKKLNNNDDPRITLLTALRPYLNSRRLGRMEQAMRLIKFSKLSSVLGDMDIL